MASFKEIVTSILKKEFFANSTAYEGELQIKKIDNNIKEIPIKIENKYK